MAKCRKKAQSAKPPSKSANFKPGERLLKTPVPKNQHRQRPTRVAPGTFFLLSCSSVFILSPPSNTIHVVFLLTALVKRVLKFVSLLVVLLSLLVSMKMKMRNLRSLLKMKKRVKKPMLTSSKVSGLFILLDS